jgi:hypothetical protein
MATIVWTRADGRGDGGFQISMTHLELCLPAGSAPASARFLLGKDADMQAEDSTRITRRPVVVLCSSARPKRRIDKGG